MYFIFMKGFRDFCFVLSESEEYSHYLSLPFLVPLCQKLFTSFFFFSLIYFLLSAIQNLHSLSFPVLCHAAGDNARQVRLRGDERRPVDAATVSSPAHLLRPEPVQPRRREDVVRFEPARLAAPLLPLLADSPFPRVLHVTILGLPQEP